MSTTLISALIGVTINYLIWLALLCIAVWTESKHEEFLVNGAIVSGVLAIVLAYVIYIIS